MNPSVYKIVKTAKHNFTVQKVWLSLFLCPTNRSNTQRLFIYYHKWQRKANPFIGKFDIFAWKMAEKINQQIVDN